MMTDKLREAVTIWMDSPCYKCKSHTCDRSCPEQRPPTIEAALAFALAEPTVKESLIAQRPWVGLTAEDMADAHNSTNGDVMMRLAGFARAIEAMLREKNT